MHFSLLLAAAVRCLAGWRVLGLDNFGFDVLLGVSGVIVTLTAAADFRYHRHAKNVASGTLDEEATVTYSEMVEHSFYQGLNFFQIVFFHGLSHIPLNSVAAPVVSVILITLPWLARGFFPINHFSDNYVKEKKVGDSDYTNIMYRIKKVQYLIYKHFLLHGLNINVALLLMQGSEGISNLPHDVDFRRYWVCLNISYVMEFFLQTLVKRGFMSNRFMLVLNGALMLASSISVWSVLWKYGSALVSIVSLSLNIFRRSRDFGNTCALLALCVAFQRFRP